MQIWALRGASMNCEPTYEELKLRNGLRGLLGLFDCEPTYEELKLLTSCFKSFVTKRLRAYLWGIETIKIFPPQWGMNKLRAYLWGIEATDRPCLTCMLCEITSFSRRTSLSVFFVGQIKSSTALSVTVGYSTLSLKRRVLQDLVWIILKE